MGKNTKLSFRVILIKMEVPIGFEPMITELQSIALPLGYGTIKNGGDGGT